MDKNWIPWLLAAILAFLLLVCGLTFFATRFFASPVQIQATPLPSPVSTPKATPTHTPLPPTPTKTPFPTGSIWSITSIADNAYAHEGFVYDVGTFTNVETGQTLQAQCAEPSWPSPPLGTRYVLNQVGVLIPLRENARPYQRFIVLEQ